MTSVPVVCVTFMGSMQQGLGGMNTLTVDLIETCFGQCLGKGPAITGIPLEAERRRRWRNPIQSAQFLPVPKLFQKLHF